MTKTVLFDCMDTLVRDPFWATFPAFFGMPMDELFTHFDREAWPRFERGEMSETEWVRGAFQDGRAFDGEALKQRLIDGYTYIDGIEALLQSLQTAKTPMHVLSNYPLWYQLIEAKLNVSRYLPWTFVSWHTGVRKPDPESYLGPVRQLKIRPEDSIFIDDRLGNVTAARDAGLLGIVFEDAAQCRRELVRYGALSDDTA